MDLKRKDRLSPMTSGSVHIQGYLGEKLEVCIQNGVMAADDQRFILPFRDRTDDEGGWGGEFWGKWFTSAALAYAYQPTQAHHRILDRAVEGLLRTQDPDGRLSSCKNDFGAWDIWGRKYA
ncbi:MAG TPA: hypothetical protein DD727_06260, partial [Clostridiales bacterium]|nr:hypothetical protein [Clostridiales bacterium]